MEKEDAKKELINQGINRTHGVPVNGTKKKVGFGVK
ncbi:hypothetical protein BMS3Abin17_01062 [archaeon BMS3Abin17]|nr:hypothetical protein BMS3Abin17_01062 [archaeon BMS3Abin17]